MKLIFLTALLALVTGSLVAHHDHAEPVKTQAVQDLARSIQAMEKRVQARPEDSIALGKLGGLCLAKARLTADHHGFERAADCFRRVLNIQPDSKQAGIGLGYALMGNHRFREALDATRTAAERDPTDTALTALMGDLHFALGNYREAELFFRDLFDRVVGLESHARLGQIAEVRGDFEQAQKRYLAALELTDSDPGAASQRAWCHTMLGDLFLAWGHGAEARIHFHQALAEEKHSHYAHYRLALMALREGKTHEADHAMVDALRFQPDKPEYLLLAAQIESAAHRPDRADSLRARVERMIRAEVEAGDLSRARPMINAWLAQPGHEERARRLARRELATVRRDVEGLELVAWTCHLAGERAQALSFVAQALAAGDGSPRLLLRAGLIYDTAGLKPRARVLLERGLPRAAYLEPQLTARAEAVLQRMKDHPEEIYAMFKQTVPGTQPEAGKTTQPAVQQTEEAGN